MKTLASLQKKAKRNKNQVISIADAADKEVLEAVKRAKSEEMCSFILFGNKQDIRSIAYTIDLDLSSPGIMVEDVKDPAEAAVKAVSQKQADILMKGNVTTKDLLKAVLSEKFGLRTGHVLSHVALFEIPNRDRLLFLTDAAMNIAPTLKEKVEIVNNSVKVAHAIGLNNPKVAALASVEVVNPAMQATIDAAALTQMQKRGQITGCIIDGPLAFDNAISIEAAMHKKIVSEVAGNADMLVVPTIDVGNALYKSFMYFAGAKVAAVISGAKAPIILTSRADSAESKLYSLSLALLSSKTF
ncbi:phosphate butyryltransferase [Virgibacillus oceani]|uniref:Phosphate butyryltransferase n=1 Tax=Virgibacillus oceani TaxID=1479511 RepID=A0A917H103_9BACI|nr:phosphate butyryltransferase [Virgibacillus oceani]GGG64076.1 phosphate butyryltransferase [Virgibacillus oceani]